MAKLKLELHNGQAAGDTLCMTSAIRDLKNSHNDKYDIKPVTNYMHMWDNNPYVSTFDSADIIIKVGTGIGVNGSQTSGLHMCNAYRLSIEEKLNINIRQGAIRGDVHLSQEEKDKAPFVDGHYWIISPGTRNQFTSKIWPYDRWQKVVESFPNITFVQIGLKEHNIPKLQGKNIIDFTGKTEHPEIGIRDLFKLCYHAQGGLSLVSFLMHLMGAFQKPCVVVAGAREPVSFEAYNYHRYLHNQGSMMCSKHTDITKSCWRTSVEGCTNRTKTGHPKCLDMITVDNVIEAFESYYVGGRLTKPGNIANETILEEKEDNLIIIAEDKSIIEEEKEPIKEDKEFEVIRGNTFEPTSPTIIPIITKDNSKIFKMVCGAHSFGGGEKSAIWIMNRMLKEGYKVLLVPTKGVTNDFRKAIPKVEVTDQLTSPCDILMFYTNDTVYGFNEEKYSIFKNIQANKKIMILNYKLGKVTEIDWSKNWDQYIFLSSTMQKEFIAKLPTAKTAILAPPVDLEPFLNINLGSLNKTLHLVRHSSQGDKKYPKELNSMIAKIRENDPKCKFSFMPAPSFLDTTIPGVNRLGINEVPVPEFLKRGTLFWYPLPDGYTDQGPRVIVEAMAVGLPVIADNRDGAKDRVTKDTGWLCDTHDQYIEVLKSVNGKDLSKKGEAAKERARKEFDPEKWVGVILGG